MYLGDEKMLFPMDQTIFDSLAWVYHQMWRADLRYALVVGPFSILSRSLFFFNF